MADHKVIKLTVSSALVGQLDPVGKTKFKPGDTVILCEASGQAISIAGWQLIEECPYCQQTSKITDKDLPPKIKEDDKKQYEDAYPSRRPIISNRAIYALVGGLLILALCIVSGVVLVNGSKLITNIIPTQTKTFDATETIAPGPSETVSNIRYTETNQPTLISSFEKTNVVSEQNTPTVVKPQSWKQGKIVYMMKQGKGAALVILNLSSDASSTVQTSTNSLDFLGASFSPDGNNIAYYAYQENLNLISPYPDSQSRNIGKC